MQLKRISFLVGEKKSSTMLRLGAVALCLLLGLGSFLLPHLWSTPQKAHAAVPAGTPPLGLNVDFNEQSLVDLIKNDPRFAAVGNTTLTEDSNGWPTSDFQWVLDNRYTFAWNPSATNIDPLKFSPNLSGTYKLSFTGQAVLTAGGDDPAHMATTISNQVYDAASNTTTADVTFGNQSGGLLSVISFTQTKRNASDSAGTGLTNIKAIRPGYAANTTQIFTNEWINSINNYKWSALRFMGALGTNDYAQPTSPEVYPYRLQWATDRLQPDKGPLYGANHVGVHGEIPWEYVVLVAQLTHKDLWINIPVNASDDYVSHLVDLFKNGNAFTNNQGIPSDVNIYVEYSNEMWHYGFPQGAWNNSAAQDEVHAGGSNLNYDNSNNSSDQWRFRRMAKRDIEISNQFKSAFNDNGTRIRPVINNEFIDNDFDMLTYVNDNYGAPSSVLYSIAITGYYGSSDTSSVSAVLAGERTSIDNNKPNYIKNRTIATYFGLHSLVYEGGQGETGDNGIANVFGAARDPGQRDVVKHNLLDTWYPSGGELFMQFSEVGRYSTFGFWGATEDLTNLNTPKWNGLVDVTNSSLPAVTAGTTLPTTPGQSVSIPETNGGVEFNSPSKTPWKEILLNVQQAGTYTLVLLGNQEDPTAKETVKVDNQLAGTVVIPNGPGDQPSNPLALNLTPGLHSLFIFLDGPGRTDFGGTSNLTITTGSVSSSTPSPSPTQSTGGDWTQCANEWGTCTFSGTQVVRYGANGQYAYQTATNSIGCNNGVFGDPIQGTVKSCAVAPVPPTSWTKCSDESGTCNVPGTVTVAFGANGQFNYKTVTGSIGCNNGVFGDPIQGTYKSCYYK